MNRHLPLVLIVALLIVFRIVGSAMPESFPNFQPLAALFFCGAVMLSGWRSWAIPLAAWLVTYPAPALIEGNGSYLSPMVVFSTGCAFAVVYLLGKSISGAKFGTLILGSVGAALAFHLITNGLAWIGSPMYAKNLEGFWQSVWAGPLGSTIPSWVFLRNMTVANVIFTAILLSARFSLPALQKDTQHAPAR
ncbi:DUF6580 family putative transport protein [Luteolibacter sp. AS25]|uniref:DUF6580 family putative transport protein n=1 Tax=Luteolibacter sp. AS25 TaxID=3135776 RepID=UPI00398AA080